MKKLALSLMLLMSSLLWAEEFLPVEEAYQISVNREGDEFVVLFDVAEGYYLYRDRYQLNPKQGANVSEAVFSDNVIVKYDPNFDEDMAIFYDVMEARHQILVDSGLVQVVYQGCADAGLCYPPIKQLYTLDGVFVPNDGARSEVALNTGDVLFEEQPEALQLGVVMAILFAMVGGLILNLMPCVFPVLSLKAMSLASHGHEAEHAKSHGLAYTFGVVISFVAVAAVLLLLRYFGDWVGWGFQLQSPYFVAFLVLLFFVMSLSMMGYIEVGQSFMGIGQGLTEKPGMKGSFFTGVLATVVATPCTAPFMGSAIGFALLQPPYISLLIFAAMGLGLAFPILLLSFIPGLAKRLPRPGAWMDVFRQLMTFPLLATALWLLWVLVEIRGSDALLAVGGGLILLTMALWPALSVKHGQGTVGTWFKHTGRAVLLISALFLILDQREQEELWLPYSEELVSESLSEGKSVFVDVTAAWCITCKANERVALSGQWFEDMVAEQDIVLIQADWTNPSPAVDALIEGYNREGVPIYAYYENGSPIPEFLPQILTRGMIESLFQGN